MTCAGIAGLVISGDMLHEPDAKVSGDQIDGCYQAPSEDQDKIDRGVDWLRRHFSVKANPPVMHTDSRSGITIISTGWSGPDGSPRGGSSASTIGIAKGPSTWFRPLAPSSREVHGKAADRRKQRRHCHQPGLAVPLQGTLARAHGQGAVSLPGAGRLRTRTSTGIATATTSII